MSVIPNENYVAFYDPNKPQHRDWLLAVLDRLTAEDPLALSEGPLRDAWTAPGTSPAAEEVTLAMALIREFEGRSLRAYPDPGTGGPPWTIGWGTTGYPDGTAVKPGDTITAAQADEYLQARVLRDLTIQEARVANWSVMSARQRAALLSFGYNAGVSWFGSSGFETLSQDIRNRAWQRVPQTLELYRNPGTPVEDGLLRRRKAEGRMFASGSPKPVAPPVDKNPLPVRAYMQLDSETDQARRMCFSSSCAMLLEFLKPGTLKGPNGDDQYLRTVQRFGDTTDVQAQLKALAHYGVKARFVQDANFEVIEQRIRGGIPVPCGYLHRGPVDRPSGGGHWLTVIGTTGSHLIVHDPFGEADLVSGQTLNSRGANLRYSRENFGKRWMVEPFNGGYRYTPGKGWAILASK